MKTRTILLTFITIAIIALPTSIAFAGFNNQNDENNGKSVERGTGKLNHKDGCNVPAQAGNVAVYIPPENTVWWGGPCCKGPIFLDGIYFPNQCCNPPDFILDEGVPGNHCLCFFNRGFTGPE